MSDQRGFDPAKYLINLKGKDYLEVKWRLVWLRDAHPDADITTELVSATDNSAIFKAHVSIPSRGSATGYGSETARDFGDFIEKAETKAIGRALGALGFGTQFADDFETGIGANGEPRIADTPVARPVPINRPAQTRGEAQAVTQRADAANQQYQQGVQQFNAGLGPTPKQVEYLHKLAGERGFTVPDNLSKQDASALIEQWKNTPIRVQGPEVVASGGTGEPPFDSGLNETWTSFWRMARERFDVHNKDEFRARFGMDLPASAKDAETAMIVFNDGSRRRA